MSSPCSVFMPATQELTYSAASTVLSSSGLAAPVALRSHHREAAQERNTCNMVECWSSCATSSHSINSLTVSFMRLLV